jgi:hypothetical protein
MVRSLIAVPAERVVLWQAGRFVGRCCSNVESGICDGS